MMTVVVLTVLWLVVVVPMVLRRNDDRAQDNSVASFGRAMRALGKVRSQTTGMVRGNQASLSDESVDPLDGLPPTASEVAAPKTRWVLPRRKASGAEVFVAGVRRPRLTAVDETVTVAPARPVPAAEEAQMHPIDPAEMSAARRRMMARRRRSLFILTIGSVLTVVLGFTVGGASWVLAAGVVAGLGGYLWFLRTEALRDRARRQSRQTRAQIRREHGWGGEQEAGDFEPATADTVVRIDDDDVMLNSMDTIDLTGLYSGSEFSDPQMHRRAG